MRIFTAFAAAFVLAASLNACVNPEQEAAQVEEIIALGNAVNNLQAYINELEIRIDSLVAAGASQDSAIARTAAFVGLVLPGRER
jgi:hypothetical protein